ncbi:citrate lyase acyl carrier protein [Isachenkonia alkalipeptolytica]|uniref:Citrate lyase acyl carrier protein n=1 Tax=Isachenkonia alkalipeptolytica TaxID=2565777 RepID=A0AA43XIX7_9CLOT|nr:citrate lyase acyl carrier protein [Isachenkonia alkalipeptolytica]NBG87169.1 citrate lyase acyl carrier protein [Isachenkonia alkalipeptolytica]
MDMKGIGQAGSLESNDVMVTVELLEQEDLTIELESTVKEQFGKQIEEVTREVLKEMKVDKAFIRIIDKGALDFAVRARIKTAINRARRSE